MFLHLNFRPKEALQALLLQTNSAVEREQRSRAPKSQTDVIAITSAILPTKVASSNCFRMIVRIVGEEASDDDTPARATRTPCHEQGVAVGCQRPVRLGRNGFGGTLT